LTTKLYLHSSNTTVSGSLPINQHGGTAPTTQGGLSPWQYPTGADATSVNRSMDTTIGASQTSIAITTIGTTLSETYYFGKWVSPPLNQTSIAANTWTVSHAIAESSLSANFIDTSQYIYVWRPSTGAFVGWISQSIGAAGFAEPTVINTENLENTTNTGSAVTCQAGDVIIYEVWGRTTQASASIFTDTFYFDGATENASATGTTVSDIASFISTPENIIFEQLIPRSITETTTVSEQKNASKIPAEFTFVSDILSGIKHIPNVFSRAITETTSIVQTFAASQLKREFVAISDSLIGIKGSIKSAVITETKAISETLTRLIPRSLTETKSVSDGSGFTTGFTLGYEQISGILTKVIRQLVETKTITDLVTKRFSFTSLFETVIISEQKLRKVIRNISPIKAGIAGISQNTLDFRNVIRNIGIETTAISDIIDTIYHLSAAIIEDIQIVETQLRKLIPKLTSQTTTIGEALIRKIGQFRVLTETVAITESFLRNTIPNIIAETTAIAESLLRTISRVITETIPISETLSILSQIIYILITEVTTVSESLSSLGSYFKNLFDNVSISDGSIITLIPRLATQTAAISESIDFHRIFVRPITETAIVISEALTKLYYGFRHLIEGPCSLAFDGYRDYVEISGTGSFINEVTVSAWVKFVDGEAGYGGIISYLNGNINNRLLLGADGKTILFELNLSGSGLTSLSYTMPDPGFINDWHHFTASYDGNNMKLYIDGSPVGSPVSAFGSINSGPTKTQIGWGSDSVYHLNGNIAELAEYNVNLTDSEISDIHNNGTITVTRGQIHYWKFNEGNGLKIKDYTGTQNGTIIYNDSWSTDLPDPIPTRSNYIGYISDSIKKGKFSSITETIASVDSLLRNIIPKISDTTTISDAIGRFAKHFRTRTETITIIETQIRKAIPSILAQTISISSLILRTPIPILTQAVTISESLLRKTIPYLNEIVIVISSSFCKNEDLSMAWEKTTGTDSMLRNVIPTIFEIINITENLFRRLFVERIMSEVTAISEAISRLGQFFRTFGESHSINDVLARTPIPSLSDITTITESMFRGIMRTIQSETVPISDLLSKFKGLMYSLTDTTTINAIMSRKVGRPFIEVISVIETQLRKVIPNVTVQSTSISDSIIEILGRFKGITETITVLDTQLRKAIPKITSQTTTITEALLRKALNSITDTVVITETQLRNIIRIVAQTSIITDILLRKAIPKITTQVITTSESIRRKLIPKITTQISAIIESLVGIKGAFIALTETIVISESLSKIAKYLKTITESKSISETLLRKSIPKISQTVNITESIQRKFSSLIATQTTIISDSLSRLGRYFRTPIDTIAISDTRTRKTIPSISAQITSIVESILRTVKPIITSQTVSISESLSKFRRIFRSLTDTTAISETLTKLAKYLRTMTETITISEIQLRKIIPKITAQTIGISETVLRKAIPKILAQTISIIDSLLRKIKPYISDTIVVSDSINRLVKLVKTETTLITESIRRKLTSFIVEITSILETSLRTAKPRISTQSAPITDASLRAVIRNMSQTISISESLSRIAHYFRTITQTTSILEFLHIGKNKVAIVLLETIAIAESIQRKMGRMVTTQTTTISDSVAKLRRAVRLLAESIPIVDIFARLPGVLIKIFIEKEKVELEAKVRRGIRGPSFRWIFQPWRKSSFDDMFTPERVYPHIEMPVLPESEQMEVINLKQAEGRKSSFTSTSFTPIREYPHIDMPVLPESQQMPILNMKLGEARRGSFTTSYTPKKKGSN
jgi:hypothetical protein